MLAAAADEVIVPSYEALVAVVRRPHRGRSTCCAPSRRPDQLEAARDAWRDAGGRLAAHPRRRRRPGDGPTARVSHRLRGPARRGRRPPRRHRPRRRGRGRRRGAGGEGHRGAGDRPLRRRVRGAGHARRSPPLRVPHVGDRASPGRPPPRSWTTGPAATATSSSPAWTATRRPASTRW